MNNEQLTVDSGQLTVKTRWTPEQITELAIAIRDSGSPNSLLEWSDVRKAYENGARGAMEWFEPYLIDAEQKSASAPVRPDTWRAKFRRAARVICKLDLAEREWRDLAIAEQAAAQMFVAERDFARAQVEDLKATLRSTTADMNRYFEELTKLRNRETEQATEAWAAGELAMLKRRITETFDLDGEDIGVEDTLKRIAAELELLRAEKNLTTDSTDSTDEAGQPSSNAGQLPSVDVPEVTQRREGAKVGRPLPSGEVLAQVFWQGFESSRKPGSRVAYGELDPETRRHQEEGIQFVLNALAPHLRPADETAETLRGRLRQVSVSLDEEKSGRLRAETKVDELEGRLSAERRAAELAMANQKDRYEDRLQDLRNNHLGEMTGVQSLLADAERKAWHGALMVQALSLGMAQAEYERLSEECWSLMKSGVDGKVLTERGAIVAQLIVDSGQLTAEEEAPPCPPASGGDEEVPALAMIGGAA